MIGNSYLKSYKDLKLKCVYFYFEDCFVYIVYIALFTLFTLLCLHCLHRFVYIVYIALFTFRCYLSTAIERISKAEFIPLFYELFAKYLLILSHSSYEDMLFMKCSIYATLLEKGFKICTSIKWRQ